MCLKECDDGYVCLKLCYYGIFCGNCMKMVDVIILKCKYNIRKFCYVDIVIFVCEKLCERDKVCGYLCLDICGIDCENWLCKKRVYVWLLCGY